MFRRFKYNRTVKKAINFIAPGGKPESEIEFWDVILIKMLGCAATLQSNKTLKYLNANKICIFDFCLFVAFFIRREFISQKPSLKYKDIDFYTKLMDGFSNIFKCKEICDKSITCSRVDFYNRIYDENGDSGIFEEFQIIIKCDIVKKQFITFNEKSPLYMLSGFDNFQCDEETKLALKYIEMLISD